MIVKKKTPSKTPIRRALMEELGPRLLFSADLPGVLAQSGLLGGDMEPTPPAIVSMMDAPAVGVAIGHQDQTAPEAGFSLSQPRASATPQKELVFVDAGAPNYQQLINDLMKAQAEGRRIEVVVLETGGDGIEQISDAMAERRDVDAVHIVSHGSDGNLQLGNAKRNAYNLDRYRDAIKSWKVAMTEGADLLIYGCDFASSAQGREMVETLSALTGADVAASTDKTGAAAVGGDWELEYKFGEVETDVALSLGVQQNWEHTLAVAINNNAMGETDGSSVTTISGFTVSGTDRLLLVAVSIVDGDGDILDDGVGLSGATVRLYRDDGDGNLDAGDTFVTSTTTDGSGNYSFTALSDDVYWVVADSKSIDPTAGFNGGFISGDAWAEETYGSVNSVS